MSYGEGHSLIMLSNDDLVWCTRCKRWVGKSFRGGCPNAPQTPPKLVAPEPLRPGETASQGLGSLERLLGTVTALVRECELLRESPLADRLNLHWRLSVLQGQVEHHAKKLGQVALESDLPLRGFPSTTEPQSPWVGLPRAKGEARPEQLGLFSEATPPFSLREDRPETPAQIQRRVCEGKASRTELLEFLRSQWALHGTPPEPDPETDTGPVEDPE